MPTRGHTEEGSGPDSRGAHRRDRERRAGSERVVRQHYAEEGTKHAHKTDRQRQNEQDDQVGASARTDTTHQGKHADGIHFNCITRMTCICITEVGA